MWNLVYCSKRFKQIIAKQLLKVESFHDSLFLFKVFTRKNDVFQRSSHSTVIISLETKRIIEKTEVQLLLLSLKLTCILF